MPSSSSFEETRESPNNSKCHFAIISMTLGPKLQFSSVQKYMIVVPYTACCVSQVVWMHTVVTDACALFLLGIVHVRLSAVVRGSALLGLYTCAC